MSTRSPGHGFQRLGRGHYLAKSPHSTHYSGREGWVPTPLGFCSLVALYPQMDTTVSPQRLRCTALLLQCSAAQSLPLSSPMVLILLSLLLARSAWRRGTEIPISPGSPAVPPEITRATWLWTKCILSSSRPKTGTFLSPKPFPPRRADDSLLICGDEKDTNEEILIQAKGSFFLFYVQIMQHNCFTVINIISGASQTAFTMQISRLQKSNQEESGGCSAP